MLPLLGKAAQEIRQITDRTHVDFSSLFKPEQSTQAPGESFEHEDRTFADKLLGRSTITRTPEVKPYSVPDRGVQFHDQDLGELRNVLYAEISNRSPEKQKLESSVIINTILNRAKHYAEKGRNLSISDILKEPNQYQGYAPDKPKSQYNVALSGRGNAKKLAAIDEVIGQLKSGTFDDNTNGAVYYKHADDGSIHVDDTKPLFARSKPFLVEERKSEQSNTESRDMSQDSIQKLSFNDRVAAVLENVKQHIPFLESHFETAVKQEVSKAYPLTDNAQEVLDTINIKDHASPKVGGSYSRSKNRITGLAANVVGELLKPLPLPQSIKDRTKGTIAGENIKLNNLDAPSLAHELTHAMFARQNIDDTAFLKAWQETKKDKHYTKALDGIEERMKDSGLYEGISQRERANEYYAFGAALLGSEGLSGMPEPLRKYYNNVFQDAFPVDFYPIKNGNDTELGA